MPPVYLESDYYEILEISRFATADEIRKSYRRLALVLHPDKNGDKPNATAAFQLLNTAYETLKDENSRRAYDLKWARPQARQRASYSSAEGDKLARMRNEFFPSPSYSPFLQEIYASIRAARARAGPEKAAAANSNGRQAGRQLLERLHQKKQTVEREISEINRVIRRLRLQLDDIQNQTDQVLAEADPEDEDSKNKRDAELTRLRTSRSQREFQVRDSESKRKFWDDMLVKVTSKLEDVKKAQGGAAPPDGKQYAEGPKDRKSTMPQEPMRTRARNGMDSIWVAARQGPRVEEDDRKAAKEAADAAAAATLRGMQKYDMRQTENECGVGEMGRM